MKKLIVLVWQGPNWLYSGGRMSKNERQVKWMRNRQISIDRSVTSGLYNVSTFTLFVSRAEINGTQKLILDD